MHQDLFYKYAKFLPIWWILYICYPILKKNHVLSPRSRVTFNSWHQIDTRTFYKKSTYHDQSLAPFTFKFKMALRKLKSYLLTFVRKVSSLKFSLFTVYLFISARIYHCTSDDVTYSFDQIFTNILFSSVSFLTKIQ